MNKKRLWNMNKQFLVLTVLPTLALGLVITMMGYIAFNNALSNQVKAELKNAGDALLTHFDLLCPGDYTLQRGSTETGETTYDLLKGDTVITQDYTYMDLLAEKSGIALTIFYEDTRILTTIHNNSNQRIVGTAAHPLIVDEVLLKDQAQFKKKVFVDDEPYFAYYAPIHNSNGEAVGMIFAGKPSREINALLARTVRPIILLALLTSFAAGTLSLTTSRKLVASIQKINRFLSKVAQGNLNTELDSRITTRQDELGDMGRSAVNMQRSLRALIEQDVLTGLHNRRYGDKRLHQLIAQNHSSSSSFALAIGDIDFFKKVNDTYGHDAGDVVLKGVAELIKKCMAGKGYAARWGGEEFLFVFEDVSYKQAVDSLHTFLDELRETTFMYRDTPIKVTMTLGVVFCQTNDNLNILLKCADDKLYKGKTEGRNQIVT